MGVEKVQLSPCLSHQGERCVAGLGCRGGYDRGDGFGGRGVFVLATKMFFSVNTSEAEKV